jgi:hypothetical protein
VEYSNAIQSFMVKLIVSLVYFELLIGREKASVKNEAPLKEERGVSDVRADLPKALKN